MSARYYVYYLIDPRTLQPFYVGKGTGDRIHQHENEATYPINKQWNPVKCKIINEIHSLGLKVIKQTIKNNLTEDQAYVLEKKTINKHGKRRDGGVLTNIVDGGGGGPRSKERPVECYTLSGRFKSLYPSTKEAAYENNLRPSQINGVLKGRANQAGGCLWIYHGDPPPEKYIRSRPVLQFDTDMNLVQKWDSAKMAAAELGLQLSSLRDCILGNHHTCGGFIWQYE